MGEAQLARGIDHLREREMGLQGALPGSPNQNKDCLRRQSWDGALRPHLPSFPTGVGAVIERGKVAAASHPREELGS